MRGRRRRRTISFFISFNVPPINHSDRKLTKHKPGGVGDGMGNDGMSDEGSGVHHGGSYINSGSRSSEGHGQDASESNLVNKSN